ncbi:MAG: hypothetical protein J3K34DRAFT_463670 [Monoraphidium minutum]|nr:MAG: hypothetical protein J3K34DRAFT_463670 [Monoraphidium minutum]
MRDRSSVLVTGCSSGGIGYAMCEEFARRGCHVFATARRPERMAGLGELGCSLLALDTANQASIDAAVLSELPDGPDILVNNAGAAMRGPVLDCPLAQARATFEVNHFGCAALVRALAPGMTRRRSGTIINAGSVSGCWAVPFMGHYSASKAALQALLELAPFGVKVVHAAPGFVKTVRAAGAGRRRVAAEEIFEKATAAGNIVIDEAGPYRPLVRDLRSELEATFARRFVSMALSRWPPALDLDGRRSLTSYWTGTFLPSLLADTFSYFFMGPWKLTSWYPWAPPLIEGGPGPALLGLRPVGGGGDTAAVRGRPGAGEMPEAVARAAATARPEPVHAPAGAGAPGEDVAEVVRQRVRKATAAVAERPIGGAPNKPGESVF